jgi:hypothetical protein
VLRAAGAHAGGGSCIDQPAMCQVSRLAQGCQEPPEWEGLRTASFSVLAPKAHELRYGQMSFAGHCCCFQQIRTHVFGCESSAFHTVDGIGCWADAVNLISCNQQRVPASVALCSRNAAQNIPKCRAQPSDCTETSNVPPITQCNPKPLHASSHLLLQGGQKLAAGECCRAAHCTQGHKRNLHMA